MVIVNILLCVFDGEGIRYGKLRCAMKMLALQKCVRIGFLLSLLEAVNPEYGSGQRPWNTVTKVSC